MIHIKIQRNNSPDNKLTKSITDILDLEGVLKNDTSLIDPVILIEANISDLRNANYMYIPSFNRRYFINNITSIKNGLIEITAHVDVLTTYKDEIRDCVGITERQEKQNNLLLNDGSLKVYQNPVIRVKKFPNGFNKNPEYVLAVAGR